MDKTSIATLGELRKSGYNSKSVKDELRDNLIGFLRQNANPFTGIVGYEQTVIPQLERAILAKHSINLLGLRGQAKTRLARLLVNLLDEYIPIVAGSEVNDDPLQPISHFAKHQIETLGDQTPIAWVHRSERYTEKLATPDVSIADLIGDVDPIKAANLKLSYADERVIHYGLVPRANRGIFVINELPDLQARIQVALFNVLQESDIQIRGFKLRLPMDIQFVFTANPEDYTNRGAIITPLKDRIQSQILTHYPHDRQAGMAITRQEAKVNPQQQNHVTLPLLIEELIEQIAIEARESEYIDAKSGVSARLTISALEQAYSSAERRMLLNGDKQTHIRIADLYQLIPAINGKIELVYEGEQEGGASVAQRLISKAIRTLAIQYFPGIKKSKAKSANAALQSVAAWFNENQLDLPNDASEQLHKNQLAQVKPLKTALNAFEMPGNTPKELQMEFLLFAMAEHSLIGIQQYQTGASFTDVLGNYVDLNNFGPSAN